MLFKKIFFALVILFSVILYSCTRQKPNTESYNFEVEFIDEEKLEHHKLYFDESHSEKFDFGDDWFECTILKEQKKNNLKSFCYCSKSFSKKFNVQVELDICAEELFVVQLPKGLYGFAFVSCEGCNFFVYNARQKKAEKLFFDSSSGMIVKVVDYKNGVIIADMQNGDQNELCLFSTAQREKYIIDKIKADGTDVKFSGNRKIQYTDENGKNMEFNFSKWTLAPCEEITRSHGATILKTRILRDGVISKSYPKTDAKNDSNLNFGETVYVLGNCIGDDGDLWACCTETSSVEKTPKGYDEIFWLRCDDVDLPPNYSASEIAFSKIISETQKEPSRRSTVYEIEISIKRGNDVVLQKIKGSRLDGQKVCFFNWNDYEDGFNYSDTAGTYGWNVQTNEIYHVSCIGNLEGCWENFATNDNKYLFAIKDFAQADFFETVEIMDISNGDSKGRWDFYKSFDYDGDFIVIGDAYYPQQEKIEGAASEDSVKHAKEFEASHEKSDEEISWGDNGLVYVKYRLSLEDFSTRFIGCEYVKGYAF